MKLGKDRVDRDDQDARACEVSPETNFSGFSALPLRAEM